MVLMGRALVGIFAGVVALCFLLFQNRSIAMARFLGLRKSVLVLLCALVFLAWLPQLLNSVDVWKSLTTVVRTGLMIILAAMIFSALEGDYSLRRIVEKTLVRGSAVICGGVALVLLFFPDVYPYLRFDPELTIPPARGYKAAAAVVALLIPLLCWIAWKSGDSNRWLALLASVACMIIVTETNNRASIAGLIGAVLVVSVLAALRFRNNIRVLWILGLAVLMAGSLVFWVILSRQGGTLPSGFEGFISPLMIDWHRQVVWQAVLETSADFRWTGIGVNTIDLLPGSDALIANTSASYTPNHPHNWMLEVGAETGVFGFLTLFLTVAVFLSRFVTEFWRTGNVGMLAIVGVWIVYWGSGLFNFSYWSAWWQASFYLAAAIGLALVRDR